MWRRSINCLNRSSITYSTTFERITNGNGKWIENSIACKNDKWISCNGSCWSHSSLQSFSLRNYHIIFCGTDHFALEVLKSIHQQVVLKDAPGQHTLHIITPPNSVHQGVEIIHPVKQYAMDHSLYFVDIPHEKRWPKNEDNLQRLIGKSMRIRHSNDENSIKQQHHQQVNSLKSTDSKLIVDSKSHSTLEQIEKENIPPHFDVGVVVSFRYLVPDIIVKQFEIGAFNIHPSDLPKYRGPAPIAWTIAQGETSTRVSFIQLLSKFDHGSIVYQSEEIKISPKEKYNELHSRLAKQSASMATTFLTDLSVNQLKSLLLLKTDHLDSQNSINQISNNILNSNFNYNLNEMNIPKAPKVLQTDCRISFFTHTSHEIYNKWRAFSENWNIYTTYKDKMLILHEIDLVKHLKDELDSQSIEQVQSKFESIAEPGEATFDKRNKLVYIQCADRKSIVLKKSQFSGKNQTNASGFAAGLSLRNFTRISLQE